MNQKMIEQFSLFGLTRQEAAIYIFLLEHGECTGYEVAKQTGISRSNVYNALSSLTDKGACYLMEGAANKYIALDCEEFCENRIRNLHEVKKSITENLKPLFLKEEGYVTVEGCNNIRNKIIHMMQITEKRMYISGSHEFLSVFEQEIIDLLNKGKKIVLLTDTSCEYYSDMKAFSKADGFTVYHTEPKGTQFHIIMDSKYAITGEYSESSQDTALYTGQRNFVEVLKEALKNEIQLITINQKR